MILDTDSQGSVTQWLATESNLYENQEPLVEVEHFESQQVERWLKRFADDYDYIFIDIPRMTNFKKDTATLALLYMCDAVLIPVIGSTMDVLSTRTFAAYMQEAKEFREKLDFPFTFYGFINRDNRRKDNQNAKDMMGGIGIPVLDSSLKDLKVFTSPSLFESILDNKDGRGRFEPFYKEVCTKLNL